MLRQEIIDGFQRINRILEETKTYDLVLQAMRSSPTKEKINGVIYLKGFSELSVQAQSLTSTDQKIISIFGLEPLFTPEFWQQMIEPEDRDEKKFIKVNIIYGGLNYFQRYLPSVVKLLQREGDSSDAGNNDNKKGLNASSRKLKVIVIEEKEVSTPERIVLMLEGIQELYDAIAQLNGLNSNTLSLIACDSGSDKSFDFLGVAQIVTTVKEIMISFWDKVVYYREDKTTKQLEIIAQSLPILDGIAKLGDDGKISPELAGVLRLKIVSGITKISKSGITIPEIEKHTYFNPRQLMKPEPKLLLPPTSYSEKKEVPSVVDGKVEESTNDDVSVSKKTKKRKNAKPSDQLQVDDPDLQAFLIEKIAEFTKSKKSNLSS